MQIKLKSIAAALMALMLIMSAGGAAAITWDAETTDTTTTSDVSGSSTSFDWYPTNETQTVYFEVDNASSSDLRLELSNGADGISTVYYKNSSAVTQDATNGHYSWNISHAELRSNLPSDYQGGTYDVEVLNSTTDETVLSSEITLNNTEDKTTARIYVENSSTTADAVGNSLVADSLDVETEEAGTIMSLLGADNDTTATFRDDTSVDGANTTVEYVLKDTETADAMDAAAENREAGEWIYGAQFTVGSSVSDTQYLKVYKNEAPEDAEGSYGVYDTGSDTLTVTTDEDLSDAQQLSVRGVAGEGYSFGDAFSNFGTFDALRISLM